MYSKAEGKRRQAGRTSPIVAIQDCGQCSAYAARRGVILLIVMVLLALMTLMGLTLVLVTAQGRLSAMAASQAGLQAEHDDKELAAVVSQVLNGSTDPTSSIGAHGIIEDMYGLPQFFGRIFATGGTPAILPLGETAVGTGLLAGGSNGQLLQLTVTPAKTSGAAGLGPQSAFQFLLPQNSGAFCGQVITMLTGPAAGQSARVVGYYFNPAFANATPPWATMQVSPFGGVVPNVGDEFMINGRPFSGTGFGFDLTWFQNAGVWQAPDSLIANTTQPTFAVGGNVPLLTAFENQNNVVGPLGNVLASNSPVPAWGMPYAYMPNHARISLTAWAPNTTSGTYWDIAGPGGANEGYDAPDYQNMMLAMHYWHPTSGPLGTGAVITPVPSLHRPELVAWFYNQAKITSNPAISMANPAMRRKVILRPEPSDHTFTDTNGNGVWDAREPFHDVDGSGAYSAGDVYGDGTPAFIDLNGDGAWTPGDTDYTGNTFNPITGCWYIAQNGAWVLDAAAGGNPIGLDVDNDMDGTPDSIWVDAGLQAQKSSDGNYYKNLAAVLCIDLDGKVNLNAHGNLAQLDPLRYGANSLGGPLGGDTGSALLYKDLYERNVPVSQGYGPPDVNPLHLFVRSESAATALAYYQIFLQGQNAVGSTPVDGRLGESSRLTIPPPTNTPSFLFPGVYPPGSYHYSPSALTATQTLLGGPRPGWSQWFDPYLTSQLGSNQVYTKFGQVYWVNDAVALSRFSDIRPGLLFPNLASLQFPAPLVSYPFFFDFLAGTLSHLPTGHGTPSDLHSRGMLTTDVTGRPYYGGTPNIPWQAPPAYWSSTMIDLAISQYDTPPSFLDTEKVLNEGIDTQYEMDLTQNAAQAGRNTGNSLNNNPDYSSVDMKFAPYELEGLLRSHEWTASGAAGSSSYVSRLNAIEKAANGATSTALGNDNARLSLTTESWDLPMPNIAPTPRQMIDLAQFVNLYSVGNPLGNALSLNINSVSLVDLARARILADNYDPAFGFTGPGFIQPTSNTTLSFADTALFGNLKNIQQYITAFPLNAGATPPLYPVWPLLAPETVLGMRFDVNRLLGNGQDDNVNGVVDEPAEVFALNTTTGFGEALLYPYSQFSTNNAIGPATQLNPITGMPNMLAVLDLNNDGYYPILTTGSTSLDPQTSKLANPINLPSDTTGADSRARQLMARQLYCLAMLLLDDRPYLPGGMDAAPATAIMAQIFSATGATMPAGWPPFPTLANGGAGSREQAAYVIAQWAINVVDFRDRDSIMTPFEFDLYPFRADDPSQPNVTWNVDDIIDPALGTPQLGSKIDDAMPWRGLVWGCERPELLMTETVAFHDRGSADTANAQAISDPTQVSPASNSATGSGPDTLTTATTGPTMPPKDKDFDQVRRPRGSLIVELFNPTSYWDAPQLDMQTNGLAWLSGLPQPWNSPDTNGNMGTGVNLAQVAAGQPLNGAGPATSPVWRIVVAYSPWQANESQCYTAPPGVTLPAKTAGPIGGSGYNGSPANLSTQIDPRVPILPPGAIHRAVYFTPFQQAFINDHSGLPTALSTVADTYLNDSFFADPDIFATFSPITGLTAVNAPTLLLPPGQYALVGPASQDPAATGNYYVFAGMNTPGAANVNVYPWKLQLGNVTTHNTTTFLYGTGGALQGPYATGYTGVTSTSTSIKPVIGVPIQTNWFQNIPNASGTAQPVYAIHSSLGLAGSSSTVAPNSGASVSTTLRMSVSEPEHGYPIWSGGTVTAQPVPLTAASLAYMQDDSVYYTPASSPGTPAPGVGNYPQHPFDSGQGQPTGTSAPYPSYLQFGDQPNPYVTPGGATQSTTLGYTVLYLQRLANPLQAWDAKMNPYITVDSMPVDLTAYTGEPTAGGAAPPEMATYYSVTAGINPSSTTATWTASPGGASSFDTRRRGYDAFGNLLLGDINPLTSNTRPPQAPIPNVWVPLPVPTTNPYTSTGTGGPTADGVINLTSTAIVYSQYGNNGTGTYASPMVISTPTTLGGTGAFGSTLGYVNWEYSINPWSVPAGLSAVYSTATAATTAQVGTSGMLAYTYNGDSMQPSPWLTWNNRPYVSQFELMLVPASSPASLARDFGMLGWQPNSLNALQNKSGIVPLQPSEYLPGTVPVAGMLPVAQFMHLLNFFNSQQSTAGTTLLPNLYRLFEFLQVPSRYTATQDMLNPSQFSGDVAIQFTTASQSLPSASHLFHTPFNWLSRYRDPGRINLNTIFDPVVFQCLMDDFPGTFWGATDPMLTANPANLWQQLLLSRQGFVNDAGRLPSALSTAPPNPVSQFAYNTKSSSPGANSDVPTYFANPFRTDGAGALVPPSDTIAAPPAPLTSQLRLMQQWSYPATGGVYNGVNSTMLRPSSVNTSLALFDDTAFDTNNLDTGTTRLTYRSTSLSNNVLDTTIDPALTTYRNAAQDAAFQYQMFTRLGNTTTNRSNVYAIWVTLGKFEVQPVAVSPSNPDGYKLVAPVLDDTGKQVVTRGFYIFDRSIPMGCQRGQDLNSERGILLERVLQEAD